MKDNRTNKRIKEETIVYSMIGCPVILGIIAIFVVISGLPEISKSNTEIPLPIITVYSDTESMGKDNISSNKNIIEPSVTADTVPDNTLYTVKENIQTEKKSLNASKQSSLEVAIDELMKLTEGD